MNLRIIYLQVIKIYIKVDSSVKSLKDHYDKTKIEKLSSLKTVDKPLTLLDHVHIHVHNIIESAHSN
jgi:hypothetical protein